jgi:hypothetical protein
MVIMLTFHDDWCESHDIINQGIYLTYLPNL